MKPVNLLMMVAVVAATPAEAKKSLIVGAGNCRDAVVLSAAKDFSDAARPTLGNDLFESDDVLVIVRPQPSRSIQEVQRQVDAAKTLLYGGQNERGLDLVQQALTELERASPQVKPWNVSVAAWLLQAQMLKNLDRMKESNEAFRRILRLDQTHKLDPDAYPPSTLQAFETVRKEVQKTKKAVLQVQSPIASAVFVDGREVGRTPLRLEVVPGQYRVALMAGEAVSFPRKVNVVKDEFLQIDMAFEGAISTQAPLCMTGTSDDAALKLASTVTAEQLIVVRNAALPGNPSYIRAVLYDVATGRQERDGGAPVAMLKNLTTFVITGRPQEGVDTGGKVRPPEVAKAPEPLKPPEVVKAPDAPKKDAPPDVKPAEAPLPPPPPPLVVERKAQSTGRTISYVAMGAGVGAAVAGVVVFSAGSSDRERLVSLKETSGKYALSAEDEVKTLIPKVATNTTMSFTLIGVGAGAAVAGLVGFFVFPAEAPQVAVVPTRDGAAFSLSGSF